MSIHRWRDSPDIVARMIDSGSIQSWSAKNIVLKPNETCVIMADGKVQDILSETVLKNYVGGFTRWLGSKIGVGSRDHKMIFAMTGPMDLLFKMEGATADGGVVRGMLNVRLQIQRDNVPKLINIFTNSGRVLNRGFFVNMYENEIMSRVVKPIIAKQPDINAIRSSDFADLIEMALRAEMRGSFDQYGITMLRAFAIVNETDLEKLQTYEQQTKVMAARADLVNDTAIEAIDRQQALTLARIEAESKVAKAKARGQVEAQLETELLELRKQEAEWEAERRDLSERQDIEISGKQRKMDIAMSAFEQVQAAKRARMEQQSDANLTRQQHTDDLQREMMKMAAENGALTPEVMQTFLEQQSVQKSHDNKSPVAAEQAPSSSCSSCGASIEVGWQVCPHCGITL
ncbi:MAG: zinc ribbon domain-containing protein [Candidatus Thermoplasmatota archaeon]|nr:zinc ribbon domain-containing protein [Candidatus Thermoplasmatota archaeon]